MKRSLQGRYVKFATAGESYGAFLPTPLPPQPALAWSPALRARFDTALLELGRLDPKVLLACLQRYLAEEGRTVTRAQFEENLAGKRSDPDFRDDVGPLLRPGFAWDFEDAMDAVLQRLVALLAGEPWKGAEDATAPKPPRRT